jgi:hypothetical protein
MCLRPVGRGPPGRSGAAADRQLDPPLDGARTLAGEWLSWPEMAAPNGTARPGLPSSLAPRTAEAATPGRQDAAISYRYLRSLAYAAVAAIAVPASLPGPASTLSFFQIKFHRL